MDKDTRELLIEIVTALSLEMKGKSKETDKWMPIVWKITQHLKNKE